MVFWEVCESTYDASIHSVDLTDRQLAPQSFHLFTLDKLIAALIKQVSFPHTT